MNKSFYSLLKIVILGFAPAFAFFLCNYMIRVLMTTTVELGRVRWSHGISYDCSIIEYKVIKFPPWLFSTMSNSAIGKKTHAPESQRWQPLPWFWLLRRRPWTIQATAGSTVERHQWWQRSNSRSVGGVRWSHGISYNCSRIEYKVIKFSTLPVLYNVKISYRQEDTRTWQSPMVNVTLILPLEATTVKNPNNSRIDSGVTAGVTVEQQQEC